MLDPEYTFCQFTHLPRLDDFYRTEALSGQYFTPPETPEARGRVFRCPSSFINSKFYQDLNKRFGGVQRANYYQNRPNTTYDWHRDTDRQCSINFMLSDDNDYLTLAREPTENRLTYNISRCIYKPMYPALLNTTFEHSVINYSNNPRFILALRPGDASFNEVKEFLLNYHCENY